ncbi:hypothetical protein [Mycoplasma suis]|nr:hypothetical protein [Mycoplasma suis]
MNKTCISFALGGVSSVGYFLKDKLFGGEVIEKIALQKKEVI